MADDIPVDGEIFDVDGVLCRASSVRTDQVLEILARGFPTLYESGWRIKRVSGPYDRLGRFLTLVWFKATDA